MASDAFDSELFSSADEQRAYEEFCEQQERAQTFQLDAPALVCRWRMAKRQVPLLNRHIRALSQRTVNGAPLSHNMLSWAKQHVEWSLAEGDYTDPNGVLMLVIDVNGNAAMTVGSYEPLGELTAGQLTQRAEDARAEQAETGVAPEVLCAVQEGSLHIVADADESLCGSMTLVVQLAETLGYDIVFANSSDALAGARFLVSDEHGVVLAADCESGTPEDRELARTLQRGVAKLFS